MTFPGFDGDLTRTTRYLGTDSTTTANTNANAKTAELFTTVSEGSTDGLELSLISSVDNLDTLVKTKDTLEAAKDEEGANVEEIIGKINELNKQIKDLKSEIEELAQQLEEAQNELQTKNDLLARQQKDYEATQELIAADNKKYEVITSKIEAATQDLEEDAKKQQQEAIYEALANYDEEKDGDWGAYLKESLKGVCADSTLVSLINGLTGQSSQLAQELGSLQTKLNSQAKAIKTTQLEITTLKDEISTYETNISNDNAQVEAYGNEINKLIPQLISPEEYALVEANNVDLTEKLEDGSPRYLFAPGKQDGKYHIYDMAVGGGTTLARQFGCDGGFDIVESGNGYMSGFTQVSDDACEGETVYYMNCGGDIGSMKATYCTSSPLSFDLNGDGVKTSNKVVNFDIDGDGIVDKINDSADAVLVFDKDGDGISGEDGSECFGDNTDLDGDGVKDGYKNGFEALLQMAKNEGLVNGSDDMVLDADDLNVLEEKYGLKIKAGGYQSEAQSLKDVGISEINLSTAATNLEKDFDGNGNDLMTQAGATFKVNGETREYADIWHRKLDDKNVFKNGYLNSNGQYENNFELKNETSFITTDSSQIAKNIFTNRQNNEKAINDAKNAIRKFLK